MSKYGEFTRFDSIKELTRRTELQYIGEEVVAIEKIHGSNLGIYISQDDETGEYTIRIAKRSDFISDTENFANHRTVMKNYEDTLANFIEYLRSIPASSAKRCKGILIMCEIYGGWYHGETAAGNKVVQRSKYSNYNPKNNIVVYDIRYNDEWLTWDQVKDFCDNYLHIDHVPEIARGMWKDVKKLDIDTISSPLAHRINGDDGKFNPIEGVVLRLVNPPKKTQGNQTLLWDHLKWKCKGMREGNLHDTSTSLDARFMGMMNQARFEAYLSKVGEDEIMDGNVGRHIQAMVSDVIKDITSEYPETDVKPLKKPLSFEARRLIIEFRAEIP